MAPPLLNGMANTPGINWTLSKWLAVKTDDARDLLIAKINTYDPSLSHDNCRGLLTAHLEFQRLVDPLYGDPVLQQMFGNVLPECFNRMAGLTVLEPQNALREYAIFHSKLPAGLIPRMGWLYAAEFVDRGLAQLSYTSRLKDLNFSLDFVEYSRIWDVFKAQLDQLCLSESEEEKLVNGIKSALRFYGGLLTQRQRANSGLTGDGHTPPQLTPNASLAAMYPKVSAGPIVTPAPG